MFFYDKMDKTQILLVKLKNQFNVLGFKLRVKISRFFFAKMLIFVLFCGTSNEIKLNISLSICL